MRRVAQRQVLAYFGADKLAAQDKALTLGAVINRRGNADRLGVAARLRHGEWVVVLYHYEDVPCSGVEVSGDRV